MHCTNCGYELQDDDTFCPNCGVEVDQETRAKLEKEAATTAMPRDFCIKCGSPLPADVDFCPMCGHKIGEPLVDEVPEDSDAVTQLISPAPGDDPDSVTQLIPPAQPVPPAPAPQPAQPQQYEQPQPYPQPQYEQPQVFAPGMQTQPIQPAAAAPRPAQPATMPPQPAPQAPHPKSGPKPAVIAIVAVVAILAFVGVLLVTHKSAETGAPAATEAGSSATAAGTGDTGTSTGETGTSASDTAAGTSSSSASSSSAAPSTSQASVPVDSSSSTDIGNLVNGGYACADDQYVYYSTATSDSEWFSAAIVREPKNGGAPETIYTSQSDYALMYHLNVTSGRVIFSEVDGKSGEETSRVVSVGTDGSSPQVLADCDNYSLCQVYEGLVYYQSASTIRVMNPDGSNQSVVFSPGNGMLWRIANDKIFYFANGGDNEVRSVPLGGTSSTVVCRASQYQYADLKINIVQPFDGKLFVLLGGGNEGGYMGYTIPDTGGDFSIDNWTAEAELSSITRANVTSAGLLAVYEYPEDVSKKGSPNIYELEWPDRANPSLYEVSEHDGQISSPTYIDGDVYFRLVNPSGNSLMRVRSNGTVETLG